MFDILNISYHICKVKSFELVLQDTIVLSLSTHLEEDSLLELEVLPHDVGDVGRLDREGDGYVRLFEDVVHLHHIMVVLQSQAKKSRWWCWHGNAITLKSQTTLPLVNLVTSTVTSSTCSAMSPSLKSFIDKILQCTITCRLSGSME